MADPNELKDPMREARRIWQQMRKDADDSPTRAFDYSPIHRALRCKDKRIAAKDAEIDKLRHELFGGDDALAQAYDRKDAEIARLRGELGEIAKAPCLFYPDGCLSPHGSAVDDTEAVCHGCMARTALDAKGDTESP